MRNILKVRFDGRSNEMMEGTNVVEETMEGTTRIKLFAETTKLTNNFLMERTTYR